MPFKLLKIPDSRTTGKRSKQKVEYKLWYKYASRLNSFKNLCLVNLVSNSHFLQQKTAETDGVVTHQGKKLQVLYLQKANS